MPTLREYGDEIEADLAFRGIDLLDLWRGKLSPRKVSVLIRGLPPDSATQTAMNGHEPMWSVTDHLLAAQVDATNWNNWIVANKDVPQSKQSEKPTPFPRPGEQQPVKKSITAEALLAHAARTRR